MLTAVSLEWRRAIQKKQGTAGGRGRRGTPQSQVCTRGLVLIGRAKNGASCDRNPALRPPRPNELRSASRWSFWGKSEESEPKNGADGALWVSCPSKFAGGCLKWPSRLFLG